MPREASREENIERVINAGVSCLYRHGCENLQLDMVAEAAGLSKRSLLRYFDSKESLMLSIFGRINRDSYRAINAFYSEHARPGMTSDARLRVLFESLRSLFRGREGRIITIVELECYLKECSKADFVKAQFMQIYEFFTSEIRNILIDGEKSGVFRDFEGREELLSDLIWNSFWGLMIQLALSCKVGKYTIPYARRVIVEYINLTIRNLSNG